MSTHNNTIPIVNGVDSSGEGDLLNLQEVTLFGNGITVSSGTDHLNITFSGSGYLEKLLTDDATSVTITCRAQSDAKYLTATILDNSETILSKRSIGYSAFPQKMVLTFSSGIGQVLRLEGTDAGVKLYEIHADAGLRTAGFKYIGFYATSVEHTQVHFFEIIIEYTGGSIKKDSLTNIQPSGVVSNNDIFLGTGIELYNVSELDFPGIFDGNVTLNDNRVMFKNGAAGNVADRIWFYVPLTTPIPDVTSFKYWDMAGYGFDLSIYGTNTDPATMSDMHDVINEDWTLLTSPSTTYSLNGGTGASSDPYP